MTDLPVQVYVRNQNRETIGDLSSWESLTVVGRRNDVGQWTLITKDPDEALLLTPPTNSAGEITARRGVIIRREDVNGTPQTIMSGWTREPDVEHSGGQTTWTFTGYDDTVLLRNAQCWPKPTAPASAQSDTHDIASGPASNRIRDYFLRNVANRQAVPGAAGGNQLNLGPSGISKLRFKGLLEAAQEIAGRVVNFTIRQRDSDRALFLYQWLPVDKRLDVQFSPTLGTVQSWKKSSTETTANQVIVGAGGEMELRVFRLFQDAAHVATWGPIEAFRDRRDISPDDPALEDLVTVAGLEFLEENKGRSTFTIDITGAPDARPFQHYFPGDLARAYIDQDANGQPIGLVDDLIEVVDVTWSAAGEEGSVQLGKADQTLDDLMANALRLALRRIADLEKNR